MDVRQIERSFRDTICDALALKAETANQYRVYTPFMYDDGDHLSIVLKHEQGVWALSDEASTYMHLSYDMDDKSLEAGTRQKIISDALSFFGVKDDDGELIVEITEGAFGEALYGLIQAMLRINDVRLLSRERTKSAFAEDLKLFLTSTVPEGRLAHDWSHAVHDPKGLYAVDHYVNGNGSRPTVIFGLQSNDKVRDATIALHQFEKWDLRVFSIGVFEDQETISRKPLARFTDVCDRMFSSLPENTARLAKCVLAAIGG